MTEERRNFYGRLKGKPLKAPQKRDMETILPELAIAGVSIEENPEQTPLDMADIAQGRPVWLEVGFGGGEHLVHQAKLNPDVCFIGVEPYINGMAMLLGKIRREGVKNIHLHLGDARALMDVLPDDCIDKAFLLYPDPWPKLRHNRRRFVTPDHLDPLARVVKSGSEFRVASDIIDYIDQAMEEVPKAGFVYQAPATDWHAPWGDWISTRYEQKAIREGRPQHYLTFHRS